MIWIGNKNFVESSYIDEILVPHGCRATRIKREAAERRMLIVATEGKRLKSIIRLKSKHIVLSALAPETLESRLTAYR
jgi:regulator of extracellular matrix RemA (YlzA/DUF370 family)